MNIRPIRNLLHALSHDFCDLIDVMAHVPRRNFYIGINSLVSAPDPTDAAADGLDLATRSGDVIHPQLRPLGLGPRLLIAYYVKVLVPNTWLLTLCSNLYSLVTVE